ncbi:family 16 glycosylhydrolase, partial [Streptococcus suis]|uniref:glycoside hydrolase family 16 protein n=3 Tax=Streptococcus TaxID=1301 RepID=UPI00129086F5
KVTWSSGRLESKDKYSFQFGRMAVRAKVNDSKGIWPAIWMLAQDETGHDEIDVLEYLGQNPWDAWTTNHFGILAKNKKSDGSAYKNYEAWSQEFHVYEVEWTPDVIKWYIDGKFV